MFECRQCLTIFAVGVDEARYGTVLTLSCKFGLAVLLSGIEFPKTFSHSIAYAV